MSSGLMEALREEVPSSWLGQLTANHEPYLVIVGVVVAPVSDTTKSPSVDLSSERRVSPMPEIERNDLLFEGLLLRDAPGSAMRKPSNYVFKVWVGEDHMKLHRKGLFLRARSMSYVES
jgi:hypothetical protein